MKTYDELIKNYNIGNIETDDIHQVILEFIEKKYDILSSNGSLDLNPGDTCLYVRDYISNIQSDTQLYYIIDDKEYVILPSTKILKFLSPLKPIFIRNKTNAIQKIKFKKWIIKLEIINKLTHIPVKEGDDLYYYGEVHKIIHDT